MHPGTVYKKSFLIRPIHCFVVVVGLFFALAPTFAQRSERNEARRGMERIDQEEGARRLEAFRQQRLEGDYVFEFELEHKPRRARTVRYDGIMWGSWNEQGAVTRVKILPNDSSAEAPDALVELIVQNGPEPGAWIRRNSSGEFKRVEGEALFEPLLPGLVYSVFDLQMPFIYWDEFTYEGPSLVGVSRVAQRFLMLPPEGSQSAQQGIKGVRVSLDDTYNALWRVEVIYDDESVRSKFAVESFKKVQEQYIVKRITLTDYPSKDRTTFDVVDADVGLRLDSELFDLPGGSESPECCDANP
ncbi:MAG: hypothetical protein R6U56_04045 [Opitutales bacterium]